MSENRSLAAGTRSKLADRLGLQDGKQREGLTLLAVMVAVMWIVEVINTLDSNHLDADGLYARNVGRFWGILTSPFIHASFAHLTDNTIPFVFLGTIIALHGARRLALVTGFVIVIGGLGTWLISPSAHNVHTIGASGVVFGYATYLLTRGFFNRNILEILLAAVVGVVWGAILLSSLIPHSGVSWQGHLCGAIAGVILAWRLSVTDRHRRGAAAPAAGSALTRT
jgi:membrane associated rhomboid family serine protease